MYWKKIKLNFYFHASLWCLKKFYEGLEGFQKTFWGTTKNCENKNLTLFFLFAWDWFTSEDIASDNNEWNSKFDIFKWNFQHAI